MPIFTFTFTTLSSDFLNMLNTFHRAMSQNRYETNDVIYRKRQEPCRVVSYNLLIQTNFNEKVKYTPNKGLLVNDSGLLSSEDLWLPLRKATLPVEINKSSWSGLVRRFNASKENSVRA